MRHSLCRLPPLSSHSYPTWACGISSVRHLVPFAALSDRHCLRVRVCCCCSGCFRCCPLCADCCSRFPLHVFCPQLLCQLLQDFPPGSPAAGAPWIRCGHWSQPGRGFYRRPPLAIFMYRLWRSTPSHLVRVLAVLCVVVVNHRLWFCLRPTKGAHTCVQVLRMQTFFLGFPWYTVRVASLQHFCVEQLRLLFHGGGTLVFVCPWCQTGDIIQLYNQLTSKFTEAQLEAANIVREQRDNESSKPCEKCNNETRKMMCGQYDCLRLK